MNKHNKKPRSEEMYKAILSLETVEECMKFFDDLCTVSEILAMEQRYHEAFDIPGRCHIILEVTT